MYKRKYPLSKKVVSRRRRRPTMRTTMTTIARPFTRDLQNIDVRGPFNTVAANMSYVNLFAPVQGTGNSSRYGNKCLIKSIAYTLFVQTGTAVPIRILIFHDKQPNQAFPTSPQPLVNLDTVSYKDPDTRQRFKILRDHWIGNNGSGAIASLDNHSTNHVRGYIKCNIPTEHTGNTGTISDLQSGAIILAAYNGGSTANAAVLSTRILYSS